MANQSYTLLIVDDSPEDQETYRRYLATDERHTYEILAAASVHEALKVCNDNLPDLVLLDYQLPDDTGLVFLQEWTTRYGTQTVPVLMMTGQGNEAIAVEAMKQGAQDYLIKGSLTAQGLCRSIQVVLERLRLQNQLETKHKQEQLLASIALRIRQSLHLDTVLQTAVEEVLQLLQADRVLIYRVWEDGTGTVITESVLPNYGPILAQSFPEEVFPKEYQTLYRQGKVREIRDVKQDEVSPCLVNFVQQFGVQAKLVVPILHSNPDTDDLWGLLIVHQCRTPRQWQDWEVVLMQQLATQLAIAIQQAALYHNLQTLNAELEAKFMTRTHELQESERRFRGIFDNTFQFTGLLTTEGILLEANQSALDFGGLQRQDVINRPFWEVRWWTISVETQTQLRQAIAQAAQGKFIRYEVEVLGQADNVATIDFSLRPLCNDAGDVILLIPEGRDITEQKQAKQALLASERRYATLAAAAPVGIFRTDTNGNCLYVNERWCQIAGLTPEAAKGSGWTNSLHPDDRDRINQEWYRCAQSGEMFCQEYRFQRPDGVSTWVFGQAVQEKDSTGTVIGYVGTITDISTGKKAEFALQELNQSLELKVVERTAELRASEMQIRAMIEAIPDLLLRVKLAGSNLESIYALNQPENFLPIHQDLSEVLPQNLLQQQIKHIQQAINTQKLKVYEHQFLKHQHLVYEEVRIVAINANEALIIVRDITERRQAELALEESKRFIQRIADASPNILYLYDLQEQRNIYVNREITTTLGYSAAEIQAMGSDSLARLMHPDDLKRLPEQVQQLQRSQDGEILEFEYRLKHADGDWRWFYSRDTVFSRDANGQVKQSISAAQDISDRKQAEEALRQSEEKFRQLAENIQSAFWVSDTNCTDILYISPAFETIWGRSRDDFYASPQHLITTMHPADQAHMLDCFARQAEGYDEEYRILRPDGTVRWIRDRAFPLRNAEGTVYRLTGIAEDITARKQAEATLNRQLAAIEASIDGIAIIKNDQFIYLNEAHVRLFGYERAEELLGQPWLRLYSHQETERFQSEVFPQFSQTRAWRGEAIAVRRDGSTFNEEVSLSLTSSGEIICICRDISERVRVADALRRSEATKQAIIEAIPDRLMRANSEGIYLDLLSDPPLNGSTSPELNSNTPLWEHLPQELTQLRTHYIQQTLQTQTVQMYEQEIAVNGQPQYEEIRMAPISSDDVLIMVRDITARKQAENQLQQTNRELAHATRLKDEFLANMSHELRTPLNAILGMAESLHDELLGPLNSRQKNAVDSIDRSGRHLLELINDILDLAKVESGKLELQIAPADISDLCTSSLTFIRQQALTKKIHLSLESPFSLPAILVDELRIRQALINLLSNAVKFTPDGGNVRLVVQQAPDQPLLYFHVFDTGIGIAPADLDKLFQPFTQIDSQLNRRHLGTGLGLSLVKRLVELHHGTISVISEVGKGSCFTVCLPYQMSELAQVTSSHPLGGLKEESSHPGRDATLITLSDHSRTNTTILLVEDNETNAMTMANYLEARGYRLLFATNGYEAINLATTQRPDLILMDIQMPEMDGLDAIARLRAYPELANTPIIAVTALAMVGDRERCLAAGASDYMTKPIRLKQLVTLVQGWLK